MKMENPKKPCPLCGKEAEYVEFTCNEAFTAPAALRFKALDVWGMYSVPKKVICEEADIVHFSFPNGVERIVKMLPLDENDFYLKAQAAAEQTKTCEHENCSRRGYACFSVFEPLDPIGFYCIEHMNENGVCPGCRMFLAGFEEFDFSPNGYCLDCRAESDEDGYEDKEDEEE